VLKCQQATYAWRTRPLYKVIDRIARFSTNGGGTQTFQSVRPAELHSAARQKDHSNV
jgi:hypothetical protein